MPTFQEKLAAEIAAALDKIKHAHLHPEEFDHHGRKLYTPSARKKDGQAPLQPRHRAVVRLELIMAAKKWEHEMMKEIIADTEAVDDAKAHAPGLFSPEQVGAIAAKMYVEGERSVGGTEEKKP